MNRREDPSSRLPTSECQRTRRWLSGEITGDSDDSIEKHLAECTHCLAYAEQRDENARTIRTDAARLENEAVSAPAHLRQFVRIRSQEATDRDRLPQRNRSSNESRDPGARRNQWTLIAVCACIAITMGSLWMIANARRQDERAETPNAETPRAETLETPNAETLDGDSSRAEFASSNPLADQPLETPAASQVDVEISVASAIAADGYVIAVESTAEDEIPFFWVLPESQQITQR